MTKLVFCCDQNFHYIKPLFQKFEFGKTLKYSVQFFPSKFLQEEKNNSSSLYSFADTTLITTALNCREDTRIWMLWFKFSCIWL
jgi:hypothetical protein